MSLKSRLFAAGFTSAVTAPPASFVTAQSLFGNRGPQKRVSNFWRFRLVWGIKPVPAIIVVQALNGLVLPIIAILLYRPVNHPQIMKNRQNTLPATILMTPVMLVSLLIGMEGLIMAVATGPSYEVGPLGGTISGVDGAAVMMMGIVIYRISLLNK
jgi:manganese transport protein